MKISEDGKVLMLVEPEDVVSGAVTIPDTVVDIDLSTFCGVMNIHDEVVISESKSISNNAFSYIKDLQGITIPTPKSIVGETDWLMGIKKIVCSSRINRVVGPGGGGESRGWIRPTQKLKDKATIKINRTLGIKGKTEKVWEKYKDGTLHCLITCISCYDSDNLSNLKEIVIDNEVIRVKSINGKVYILCEEVKLESKLKELRVYRVRSLIDVAREAYLGEYRGREVVSLELNEVEKKVTKAIKEQFMSNIE
jgi:hypothetical protein